MPLIELLAQMPESKEVASWGLSAAAVVLPALTWYSGYVASRAKREAREQSALRQSLERELDRKVSVLDEMEERAKRYREEAERIGMEKLNLISDMTNRWELREEEQRNLRHNLRAEYRAANARLSEEIEELRRNLARANGQITELQRTIANHNGGDGTTDQTMAVAGVAYHGDPKEHAGLPDGGDRVPRPAGADDVGGEAGVSTSRVGVPKLPLAQAE